MEMIMLKHFASVPDDVFVANRFNDMATLKVAIDIHAQYLPWFVAGDVPLQ
jgi:hypothetical protein